LPVFGSLRNCDIDSSSYIILPKQF